MSFRAGSREHTVVHRVGGEVLFGLWAALAIQLSHLCDIIISPFPQVHMKSGWWELRGMLSRWKVWGGLVGFRCDVM